jgi:hypothetical protein
MDTLGLWPLVPVCLALEREDEFMIILEYLLIVVIGPLMT